MHEASNDTALFWGLIFSYQGSHWDFEWVFCYLLALCWRDRHEGWLNLLIEFSMKKKCSYILLKHLCEVSPQLFVLYPWFADGIDLSLFIQPCFSGHAHRVLVKVLQNKPLPLLLEFENASLSVRTRWFAWKASPERGNCAWTEWVMLYSSDREYQSVQIDRAHHSAGNSDLVI